jgi:hypothetical protein
MTFRPTASTGMPARINVGLSIHVDRDAGQSIWANGAVQNIIFLYLLLGASPEVGELWLINAGDGDKLPAGMMTDDMVLPLAKFEEVADRLDVLIEGGAQLPAAYFDRVRARGGVTIAYRCGNDYVMDVERLSFGRPSGSIFNGARVDEIWTHAQHEKTCGAYWRLTARAPVAVVPHIWGPLFLDKAAAELAEATPSRTFGYRPGPGPKRVAVFEPNINVVKSCIYPMLICEAAHREDRSALKEIYVTNAIQLKDHVTFQHFAHALDIVRDRRASFEARYNLPYFLGTYADIVVSHQWENGLNYAYYDALHGRYPLVHNSPFLRDVGYYYADFDAEAGGRQLLRAVRDHDRDREGYDHRAARFLRGVQFDHRPNVEAHVGRLFELLRRRRAGTVPAASGTTVSTPVPFEESA